MPDPKLIFFIMSCIVVIKPVLGLTNGVNLQPSYYNNGEVTFGWDLMARYAAIKTVRIEIEPDKAAQAKSWIAEAVSHGMQVIATYHNCRVLGTDDSNELLNAANWWKNNYDSLKSAGDFAINLMNEWGSHNQSPQSYASAYNEAVSILRKFYGGYIIIDVPGWGQEINTAIKASSLLSDKSLIFSAHIYPNGWNQGAGRNIVPDDMSELAKTGRPCILGEFGTDGGGPVDVAAVVRQARSSGFWAVLGWAWNGDGGKMNMLTPSWSENARSDRYAEGPYFAQVYSLLN